MIMRESVTRTILGVSIFILTAIVFPSPSFSLSVGDVTYYDVSDLADATRLKSIVERGVSAFNEDYPELAQKNAWLEAAVLSVGSSRSVDAGSESFYARFDLDYGKGEASLDVRTDPFLLTPEDVASLLRNLVYTVSGFPIPSQQAPVLVRKFSIEGLIADIPYAGLFTPTSVTVLPDGHVVFGHTQYATIIDPFLRIRGTIGKELAQTGKYPSVNLQASASGTVITNVLNSGELLQFNPLDKITKTVLTGLTTIETYAWLNDGSVIAKESFTPRVVVVEKNKRRQISLSGNNGRFDTVVFAAGPDSTLVAYNCAKKNILFYDTNGKALRHFIPCLPDSELTGVRGITSLSDGGFLLRGYNFITKIDSAGYAVWRFPLEPLMGNMILDAAWSERERSIFMILPGNKNVYQYMEPKALAVLDRRGPDYPFLAQMERTLSDTPDDLDALKALASYYDGVGAEGYALSLYRTCVQLDPYDETISARVSDLTARSLVASAAEYDDRARERMAKVGPESAKADYSQAMGLYERALASKPGDQAILDRRSALGRAMKDAEAGINTIVPPLSLEPGPMKPIFPALLASYGQSSIGAITIGNNTGKEVRNVRVSLQILRFMDFPTEVFALPQMKNGSDLEVPLYASFNRELLSVEEDMPVQAKILVEWTLDGVPYSMERSVKTIIYRRTALTWDDSGKIASFITPNEETVGDFAMNAMNAIGATRSEGITVEGLSRRLYRADALIASLSAYGIKYLEDPQAPLSGVIDKPLAVDTVRFPRATLLYRGGDCDDTTALVASLLEAVGIPTAIMTSPGHIFLAIDTGISEKSAWTLDTFGSVIARDGSLWMPIETTVLDKGLIGSWQEASRIVVAAGGLAALEFIPLSTLRDSYPAVPLPTQAMHIELPQPSEVSLRLLENERTLVSSLYEGNAKKESVVLSKKEDEAHRLNRLGILHAMFNNAHLAEASFKAALGVMPDFFPALQNMANLSCSLGNLAEAEKYLSRAKSQRPDAAAIAALERTVAQLRKAGKLTPVDESPLIVDRGGKGAMAEKPRASQASKETELPSWEE